MMSHSYTCMPQWAEHVCGAGMYAVATRANPPNRQAHDADRNAMLAGTCWNLKLIPGQ